MTSYPLVAVSACAAPTGLDSGDPRWRRNTDKITIDPTARNSDCQFRNVRFQKSDVVTYVATTPLSLASASGYSVPSAATL